MAAKASVLRNFTNFRTMWRSSSLSRAHLAGLLKHRYMNSWAGPEVARITTAKLQKHPIGLVIAFDDRDCLFTRGSAKHNIKQQAINLLPVKSDIKYEKTFFEQGEHYAVEAQGPNLGVANSGTYSILTEQRKAYCGCGIADGFQPLAEHCMPSLFSNPTLI